MGGGILGISAVERQQDDRILTKNRHGGKELSRGSFFPELLAGRLVEAVERGAKPREVNALATDRRHGLGSSIDLAPAVFENAVRLVLPDRLTV